MPLIEGGVCSFVRRWVPLFIALLGISSAFPQAESDENVPHRDLGPFPDFAPPNGVILIPGIGGSGLYVTLNNAFIPECSEHTISAPRSRIWASIVQALPPASRQRCWTQKLALQWDTPARCQKWATARRLGERKTVEAQQSQANGEPRATGSIVRKLLGLVGLHWPFFHHDGGVPIGTLTDPCEPHYFPLPGVEIEVDSPNGTRGIEYLDYVKGMGVYGTKYFHDLVEALRVVGYEEGDTLLAHPYDWRLPLWQYDYSKLKEAIEDFVQRHPNKKVAVIAHSLGAAMANFFFNRIVTAEWKAKHIESFVPIAGVFGGSHKVVRSLLSGCGDTTTIDFFGVVNLTLIPPLLLRRLHRTFGSMYSIMPNAQLFGEHTPIVEIVKGLPPDPPNVSRPWTIWGCPVDGEFLDCLLSRRSASNTVVTTALNAQRAFDDLVLSGGAGAMLAGRTSSQPSSETSKSVPVSMPSTVNWGTNDVQLIERRLASVEAVHVDAMGAFSEDKESSASKPTHPGNRPPIVNLPQHPTLRRRRLPESPFTDPPLRKDWFVPPTAAPGKYTVSNWWTLLPEEFQERAKQGFRNVASDTALLDDPGVRVYCLWTIFDFPSTEVGFEYLSEDMDAPPTIRLSYGDSTVAYESASHCQSWASTVFNREFRNLDHMGILFNSEFIRFVVSLVSGIPVAVLRDPLETHEVNQLANQAW